MERLQLARCEGAGVDADAPRPVLKVLDGRVAVDDHEIEFRSPCQERFTDPEHVAVFLVGERNTRIDTGMHEKMPAGGRTNRELIEKGDMRLRNCLPDDLLQMPSVGITL